MDIQNVRAMMRTKSIYDIPLRVTFYARVSSESDEQLNSLDNQVSYYEDFIKRNAAWQYVRGYVDEGLSGISTRKRKNFNRMITDAKDGKFDLIITKEISRFARNTVDSLQYTRELQSHGVGVFFQNDNINTLDEDAELRLTIMSSIAQDELRKLSSRVRFGHQQAIKSHVVLGNGRMFGYLKKDKHLVIDESEAPMIRELFRLYATDQYSMKQLEDLFFEQGYRNHNGNKIAHTTMSGIISNPKYKGYYVGNKVRIVDMFTQRQKFLPQEEWVMFKDETGDIVPAIVSEEVWEAANEVLQRRSLDVKSRQGVCNHSNLMTGKLYCAHCGMPYYRRESKDRFGNVNSKWVCSGKIKNGYDSCPSAPIYESELKPVLFEVFSETQVETEATIERYREMFEALEEDEEIAGLLETHRRTLDMASQKKAKLLELVTLGAISNEDFKEMTAACERECREAREEIDELEKEMLSKEAFRAHINELRRHLQAACEEAKTGIITHAFVNRYISKVTVTFSEDGTGAKLDIEILAGNRAQKWLHKLKTRYENTSVRTGHTFKKMIESYENGMTNGMSK
ncbi:MAG: recombinase family protein [Clostridia bacterium]|nr:recombinase family protein [Clostridia bacterium]